MSKIEESYARRLVLLPADTRLLILAAAAEPLGDLVLLGRAADALGLELAAADPAVDAGLLTTDGRVEFAHPLVRSAAYRAAAAAERRRVHHALAEATDGEADPDRRAWHRARATPAPDEDVAAELERCASRAQARGGVAAAAAFLERAVELTPDPSRRAARALAAAQATFAAGSIDSAEGLLTIADADPLDELPQARIQRLRAELAFSRRRGRDAPPLVLRAAQRFEALDAELACETYLEALVAALYAGRFSVGYEVGEIARAVRAAPIGADPVSAKEHSAGRAGDPLHGWVRGSSALAQEGARDVSRRRPPSSSGRASPSTSPRWTCGTTRHGSSSPPRSRGSHGQPER